ncbi:MAG: sulfotransferase [Acetobacteraceae bacterium]
MPAAGVAFVRGEDHYRAGRYAQAAAVFRDLHAAAPEESAPVRMLGLCQLHLGRTAEALTLLSEARDLAPDDPQAQLHYGIGLQAAGRHAEAADQFRRCQHLMPSDPAPFLNLATALLDLGDPNGALDAARRARRRAINMPQAHYTVGLALMALDRQDDAIQAFADTLRFDPRFADAWINLGVLRYRRGNIAGAKEAMRQALAARPGYGPAVGNLAAFMRLTGESEAAETLLQETLAQTPDADGVRANLAAALLQEDRAIEALALLDARPVPADPRLAAHWRLQRILALLQQGRVAEAGATLAEIDVVPPDLGPLLTWRRVLLAQAAGDADTARRHAEALAAELPTAPLVPEHRIIAHYDLARFWLTHGERTRAFGHWTEGHALLRRFQPFSRDAHRAFIDASIARLDRTRLCGGPRASNRDPAPVFIVGLPRSGTTLAEQIIGAHPQTFAAGERGALTQAFFALAGTGTAADIDRLAVLDSPRLDEAARSYLAELHALAPAAARIVDKMPGNTNFLGLVALMLPGARIIHCVRDPRDIGLSIFTFRFYGHHPYAHDLADLGWYIGQQERLMTHWKAVLPNPVLTLALQDWVQDFDATLRRVLAFIDLPYDPACARFHEQASRVRTVSRAQVRQPVNARGLGRWRSFEAELQPLIAELSAAGLVPDDADQPSHNM